MNSESNLKHRCQFEHKDFLINDHHRYDETNRCWMTKTKDHGDKKFCVFHHPLREKSKSSVTLMKLISQWNAEQNEKSFVMPKVQCANLEFTGVVFKSNIYLQDAHIFGKCNFSYSEFNNSAYFQGTNFYNETYFENVKFKGKCHFKYTIFNIYTSFDDSSFDRGADFESGHFQKSSFENCKFQHEINFKNATFNKQVKFNKTEFDGKTIFINTKFKSQESIFLDVKFWDVVYFQRSIFSGITIFQEAHFGLEVNFDKVVFDFGPDMSETYFFYAPSFHDATLGQGVDFREAHFVDKTSRHAPSCYRTLKLAMNKVSNKRQEAIFYGLEQQSLRKQRDTPISIKFYSYLYQLFSNYGQSVSRPFYSIITLYILFISIYSIIKFPMNKIFEYLSKGAPDFLDKVASMIKFTTINITSPFKVWTNNNYIVDVFGPELAKNNEVTINIIATFQSIFSLSLITLFILALRRAFKLN